MSFSIRDLEYTKQLSDKLDKFYGSEAFERYNAELASGGDCDALSGLIYAFVDEASQGISFGNYLKRYLYRRFVDGKQSSEFSGAEMGEIPDEYFADLIVENFQRYEVKPSFGGGITGNYKQNASRWLTQVTVQRDTIFLLGFGLAMTSGEVNEFLMQSIHERGIHPKNPLEVIRWFCYEHIPNPRMRFSEYERLTKIYREHTGQSQGGFHQKGELADSLALKQNRMEKVQNKLDLYRYLQYLSILQSPVSSVSIQSHFDTLYSMLCETYKQTIQDVSDLIDAHVGKDLEAKSKSKSKRRNWMEERDRIGEREGERERGRGRIEERATGWDKDERRKQGSGKKEETAKEKDFGGRIIEQLLFGDEDDLAVPKNRYGNLSPQREANANFNAYLIKNRFDRQNFSRIMTHRKAVTRYDLISLNFLIHSLMAYLSEPEPTTMRQGVFIENTNQILQDCLFGKLYIRNPYELLCGICMRTEDPLEVYKGIYKIAYSGNRAGRT